VALTNRLDISHQAFTAEDVELFKEVRTQCLQLHPRLMNFFPGTGPDAEAGMHVVRFPEEIENDVEAFYKRMYDQDISVEEAVQTLQTFKASDRKQHHDFFACFLHSLFEEARFFPTYPPKELALTAFLFGSIIQHELIDYLPLGIAVRYTLDALRNPPDSAWFTFGLQALSRFANRLSDWPQLAHSILSIPHLPPDVAALARRALARANEAGERSVATLDGFGAMPQVDMPPAPAFTAIHVDEDQEGEIPEPDVEASDRILFHVNNLAPNNLEAKVAEVAGRMADEYFRWFAHYLVTQRVSLEPNNHQLYLQFLEALDRAGELVRQVLKETYARVEALLNSEKTVSSSNERTLLKNLGSWLGALTLAKDKPIKHRHIAFKELLVQGYDSHRLIVAIPFVCKVLEQGARSRVFKPPNPWLMAILRVLVELYHGADLKLNLKFEIEVLCKSLGLELKDIEPADVLRNRPDETRALGEPDVGGAAGPNLVPDFERLSMAGSLGSGASAAFGQPPTGPLPSSLEQGGGPGLTQPQPLLIGGQAGYALGLQDAITNALANLPAYVIFSPTVPLFHSSINVRRAIQLGIERAIREIIAPVVERSVTIATLSTRELILKDFAMEGDDEKMRDAAHRMVRNLAGNLALVTCREPLRNSIISHVRGLFLSNGYTEVRPQPAWFLEIH
jgi:CCR4-NOT transcription complex subunit 1